MTGAKNMRKRLTLKEKVALIEDSMQPGFKQSKAAMKWGISPGCVNSILKNKTKIIPIQGYFQVHGGSSKL